MPCPSAMLGTTVLVISFAFSSPIQILLSPPALVKRTADTNQMRKRCSVKETKAAFLEVVDSVALPIQI